VKRKWSYLKFATKKHIAALKRTTTQTGGGQTDPIVLTPTEERVAALIGSASIMGISGRGDTDEHVSIQEKGLQSNAANLAFQVA